MATRSEIVYQRAPNWKHKKQKQVSLKSGRALWIWLPIEKVAVLIYQLQAILIQGQIGFCSSGWIIEQFPMWVRL